ncbi:hypothetical protein, partial [Frankia sp. AgKG'84/4]|uniref:hypothetical protein n=1 Tax=Frankia sp. AgKG'84/4 TaxID=573490 RepID=UPI00202A6D6E
METVQGSYGTYVVREELSRGGIGSIHRTGDPGLVFKRYFDPDRAPSRENLERLVKIGRAVSASVGAKVGGTPESSVNWPVDVEIGPQGRVSGVVLPIIPKNLFHEEFDGVRTLDFLVMARARPPAAKGRIALLMRMAEILSFVHSRGLVHGDVNGKNLAWSVAPRPVMYLIDCDGMVPQTPAPTEGVQAIGWADPRLVERRIPAHDHRSDWYALALAMYRGLLLTPGRLDRAQDGSWPAPKKIPKDFPTPLADLIRRGLEPTDADRRPAPQEWVRVLRETYLPAGSFDNASVEALDRASAPPPTRPTTVIPPPASGRPNTARPAPTAPRPAP